MQVFLSLSFDEDLRKPEAPKKLDNKTKKKNFKKGRRNDDPNQVPASDKKKNKQEMMSKTREEVKAEFMAASFAQDAMEKRRIQSDTLSAVFQTYFRILKHTMHSGYVHTYFKIVFFRILYHILKHIIIFLIQKRRK